MKKNITHLGLIAGRGLYPLLLARAARARGVHELSIVGFPHETDPELEKLATNFTWLAVGQLGKLLQFFRQSGARYAIMAGQVAPQHLFDLKPDWKALLLLAKLKERNAATIFGAIGDELAAQGIELLPATTFLEESVAQVGWIAGPNLKKRQQTDAAFGFRIAKETARLDIGQSVVVKNGTVLAVEAFEGTDATMKRGGPLGRGNAVLVKVSKPHQDFRFDVPVIGAQTLETARAAGIRAIACEAGATLLLDLENLRKLAADWKISLLGMAAEWEKPPLH